MVKDIDIRANMNQVLYNNVVGVSVSEIELYGTSLRGGGWWQNVKAGAGNLDLNRNK